MIKAQPPSAPPSNVTVASGNDKIVISWMPVGISASGGDIKSYNVRWRMAVPSRNNHPPDRWSDEGGFGEVRKYTAGE